MNYVVSEHHVNVHTHARARARTHVVHSLTQCVFLLQKEFLSKLKESRRKHHADIVEIQVRSVFLACLIQPTSLYFLNLTAKINRMCLTDVILVPYL